MAPPLVGMRAGHGGWVICRLARVRACKKKREVIRGARLSTWGVCKREMGERGRCGGIISVN